MPLSQQGLGGGAASLFRGGAAFPGYNEPKLANGSGLIFGPYDNFGNVLVGYLGPTKANLRQYYKNLMGWGSWVDDDTNFSTTTTGIQVWHAPESRSYTFEMETPKFHTNLSNGSPAGDGRHFKFSYNLTAGDRLFILPGQRCHPTPDGNSSHGGNGGTFLVMGNSNESNLDTDLYNCVKSSVLAVCGGAGKAARSGAGSATAPGNHPSGGDDETLYNNGSGRSFEGYHGFTGAGGPSGGAGFLRGACQHNASGNVFFRYSEKQDSTSFIYDADAFVRGGLGGRGYIHNASSLASAGQGNNGMNGSGGFGGGGGQSTQNSYNSGAGGYQGGNESDGTSHYPSNHKYSNGADRHCGGGSYVKAGISLAINAAGTGNLGYVKITYT